MSWKCPICSAQWPLPPKGASVEPVCYFCVRANSESHPDVLEFPYDVERVRNFFSLDLYVTKVITLNVALKDVDMPPHLPAADPYGFISCMGAFSIETEVALVATSRTYSSKLIEMEKTIEPLLPIEGDASKGDATPPPAAAQQPSVDDSTSSRLSSKQVSVTETDDTSNSVAKPDAQANDNKISPQTELKNLLIAYFCLTDLGTRLGMPNLPGVTKHALSLSQSNMRNRHVESMAIAALVMASRQFNSPRTIQEVARESSVRMKEIGRYLKLMNESQKDNPQRPPENSSLVVEYVQRFCKSLSLNQRTQDVATHIATQLITQTLTTRQNPVSISAASIYITCLLEDVKRTQADICRAAALTEVTLRKCYREVAVHCKALLPPSYVPAVPIDRALGTFGKPGGFQRVDAPDPSAVTFLQYVPNTVSMPAQQLNQVGLQSTPSPAAQTTQQPSQSLQPHQSVSTAQSSQAQQSQKQPG